MFTVSVVTNHWDLRSQIVKINSFNELKTNDMKEKSPMWSYNSRGFRDNKDEKDPYETYGFVFDMDSVSFNVRSLEQKYEFYYHKTHNKKFRVWFPFEKPYKFNKEMFRAAHELAIKELKIDESVMDTKCRQIGAWFYWIKSTETIYLHAGLKYTPLWKDITPYSKFSRPTVPTSTYQAQRILSRVNSFYRYYCTKINWKLIFSEQCHMGLNGLHDADVRHDIDFNLPNPQNGYIANIYCHHSTCKERLNFEMEIYQSDDLKQPRIKNYTVQYLAKLIIDGQLSIDHIEALGVVSELIPYLSRMFYFTFHCKVDTPKWIKYLHENIVTYNTLLYHYKNGYYQQIPRKELKYYYHMTIGTYVGYRTNIKTKPYIDELFEYAQGEYLNNMNIITHRDGIVLKNGVLLNDKNNLMFKSFSKCYFITDKFDFDYDPKQVPKIWLATLIDYFDRLDAPQVLILQEFFGYALTFDHTFEKFLVMFGASRAGKNTIAETLLALVGGVTAKFQLLSKPDKRKFLVDKKIAWIDETIDCKNQSSLNELKRMVSTGAMEVKPLYEEVFNTFHKPKLIVSFNNAPEDLSIDTALKNRMLTLKFTKTFVDNPNVKLKKELKNELSGILNWALEGHHRLYKNERFTKYEEATDELYNNANLEVIEVRDFIESLEKRMYLPVELLNLYIAATGDYKNMTANKMGRYLIKLGYKKVSAGKDGKKYWVIT